MPLADGAAAIPRSLLRDAVHDRIRDAIVDGVLAPGEQLRDLELAERLGVSRTPVREALLRLGEVGLVVTRPGRSTAVAELDPATVRDARDVVAGLHAVGVRVAAERFTPADLDEMRAANERFAAAVRAGDVAAAHHADEQLHAVPLRVAGNRAVETVLGQYLPVVRRMERLRFAAAAGLRSVDWHDTLIAHCAAGDARAAADLTYDTWHTLTDEPMHEQTHEQTHREA